MPPPRCQRRGRREPHDSRNRPRGKFVKSVRGQTGGYALARSADNIPVGEVLAALGGRLFEPGFCDQFPGLERRCTHSVDCSIRSLWRALQSAVDTVLTGITLRDLLQKESAMAIRLLSAAKHR